MAAVQETVDRVRSIEVDAYKYGFVTDIESDKAPKGLSEDIVRFISAKKGEPQWLLDWRLDAYRRWLTMDEPRWARVEYPEIDFQDLYYYSAPKSTAGPKSLDEVDPELLRTYAKLGIPLVEQEILAGVERPQVAVDAVFDSVSVATTFKAELAKAGVIFCSISEAVREHPELVQQVSRLGGAADRQFLRDAEFGGVLRRLVRLRAAGRALPDGAVDLFPHQREEHRPVRAHADHRRQGRLRQLSRRLHGAQARREPASRRGGRARRARRRRDQVFDGAELVSRRRRGQGRHLQFRHQARRLPRRALEDLLDAGRDRLGDHLEVPVAASCAAMLARRILFDRHLQRPPAGRQRHQDDPSRQEHDQPRSSPRASPPAGRRTPIAARSRRIARRPARAISPIATRC